MPRKTFWTLFGLAAVLRILLIWRAPLWYDENFTLLLARLPFGRMLEATAGDVHPPLWYLIEWLIYHAWTSAPAWVIRLPALTFSLLAFVMFVRVCEYLQVPMPTRDLAVFLMAVLPMQIWYAQEGRMYALLEYLVLAALWTALTRQWILFTLAAVLMLYTQNYAAFYLAVIGVIALSQSRTALPVRYCSGEYLVRGWLSVVTSGLAASLLFLPWAFVLAGQAHEIEGHYWIMDISTGSALTILFKQFWNMSIDNPGLIPSFFVTMIALILGTMAAVRRRKWLILSMAYVPLLLAWLVSALWQPVMIARPLIGTAPFLYLLVAMPVENLSMGKSLYASLFIAPILFFGLYGYYTNIADAKGEGIETPLTEALAFVRSNWKNGDVIFYADDGPMVNLMPYAADLPQYRMPQCYEPVHGSLSDRTRAALGVPEADPADIAYKRLWVFAPRSPLHPQCYFEQIAPLTVGDPVLVVDDYDVRLISSGVWLIDGN